MMSTEALTVLIRTIAIKFGVCDDLAVALAARETSLAWPKASTRFEPKWATFYEVDYFASLNGISKDTERREQATSWGPLQIMGTCAREEGFQGPLPLLFDPATALEFTMKKLKKLCDKYEPEAAVIAAWNAGSPKKVQVGPGAGMKYINQDYVDDVVSRLNKLRKI